MLISEPLEQTPPAEKPSTLPMDKLKRFVELEKEKTDLAAKEKRVKAELAELELEIWPIMIDQGVPQIKVDGRLVYIKTAVYASPAEEGGREKVIAALKSIPEMAMYVAENFNSQSLNSWAKELAASVEEQCKAEDRLFNEEALMESLPDALRSVLKIGFKKSLESRKG